MESMIEAQNVSIQFASQGGKKSFGALSNINFTIAEGEFVSLIGPSGCGKSTLVNAIAGFVPCTSGQFLFKKNKIIGSSRDRVVIFQNHSLFPWKTAFENIAFSLRARGVEKSKIHSEVMNYLKLVKLEEFKNHLPKELSGGMQQRIGIARALAADPEVLLLDEPFASLDQFTRDLVQEELMRIIKPLKKTSLLVTHNINEALFFADRIFVMSGRPGTIKAVVNTNFKKPNSINEIDQDEQLRRLKKDIYLILNSSGESQ
jgi:NitT/TauT family transport system ATP-binding protein